MNELQIALICVLCVLGLVFIFLIIVKFRDNPISISKPSLQKIEGVIQALENNHTINEQWDNIWPLFYKNGEIKYEKIETTITYIINDAKYASVQSKAINLLKNKVSIAVYGDNEISNAILEFRETLNMCGHQEVKESGNILIDRFQKYCKSNKKNSKYDGVIQWIFNAIEIVGLILAIVTL